MASCVHPAPLFVDVLGSPLPAVLVAAEMPGSRFVLFPRFAIARCSDKPDRTIWRAQGGCGAAEAGKTERICQVTALRQENLGQENTRVSKQKHFIPTSFRVRRDNKTGEWVQISFFKDDGDVRQIAIPRFHVPLIAASLLKEAKAELDPVIDADALQVGGVIQLLGNELLRRPDGSVHLTFHLRTDDGARVLHLNLTADEALLLAKNLTESE